MYIENRGHPMMKEEWVLSIGKKIADGLKYLHSRRIVHRDIKPENILMSSDSDISNPSIIDFGYAKYLSEDKTCSSVLGTLGYIAPEIIRQENYSFPVDIWGFGVILYSLICGKLPFPSVRMKLA